MLLASFDAAFEAGCIQTGADTFSYTEAIEAKMQVTFNYLQLTTNTEICRECPVEKKRCKCYRLYNTNYKDKQNSIHEKHERARQAVLAQGTEKYPKMSIKQIAEKLQVSKNEVRRMKQRGEL